MAPPLWGVLAGLTGLAGYLPYLRDAWRRASDPDPAAWLIWTVQYGILLASQVAQHPPWSALVLAGLQLAGTVLVFGVLAARGGWRFGASRWAVLVGAVIVMFVWWFTRAPTPAMCLALAVEGAGMVLVMLNAYRHPGSETILTWWIFIAAGLFDLPALWEHTPRMLYAYPVFFIVMGTGVLLATGLGARVRLTALLRAAHPAAGWSTAPVAAASGAPSGGGSSAGRPAAARRPAGAARVDAAAGPARGWLRAAYVAEVSALLRAAEVPAGVRVAEASALLQAAGLALGGRPARAAAARPPAAHRRPVPPAPAYPAPAAAPGWAALAPAGYPGPAPSAAGHPAAMTQRSAQRERYLAGDGQRARLPRQVSRQARSRESREELRERGR